VAVALLHRPRHAPLINQIGVAGGINAAVFLLTLTTGYQAPRIFTASPLAMVSASSAARAVSRSRCSPLAGGKVSPCLVPSAATK